MTTVIDFYADWCSPCKTMTPILKELEKEFPDVTFEKVDIMVQTKLAQESGVMSIPTIVIKKDDKETKRFVGIVAKSDIVKELT
jgi:thioredoxin 1